MLEAASVSITFYREFVINRRMIKKAQQMVVFNALTHQRSFTKAAQLLDISRTQVSKQVQQLEQRLGVQLVQRTTRSFSLTEAGGALCCSLRQYCFGDQ